MKFFISLVSLLIFAGFANASENPLEDYRVYRKAVSATAQISKDPSIRKMVKDYGLDIMNFTWEDTVRDQGSSYGPNISDMSIQVHVVNDKGDTSPVLMPVVRYPNFTDKTADIPPKMNNFVMLVGNEKGEELKKVSLTDYLGNFRKYLSMPEAWTAETDSLLAPRDTHVLTSAQVTYLPVPKGQKATFNPVLFNYQSEENNSAVLAILATREGTSATIINNTRNGFEDGVSKGQRLFFNQNGMRASLTGDRKSDFLSENPNVAADGGISVQGESGLNMVMLIQVPLKHKARPLFFGGGDCEPGMICPMFALESVRSLVEDAVIGHGELEGPFVEIDTTNDLGEEQQVIERDNRYPVRVTVQFYKATDSAKLTVTDVENMKMQIDKVYSNADYVGSLVTEGKTLRPTEVDVPKCVRPWWPKYAGPYLEINKERHLANPEVQLLTSEEDMDKLLKKNYGIYWPFWCASQASMTQAMDYITGYQPPAEEKPGQNENSDK